MKVKEILFNNHKYQIQIRSQADKSVLAEIFELQEYKDIEPIIKSARSPIIDAGAQAGFFVLYCRALNPEVKILAIEPDQDNLDLLENHLTINKIENVGVFPAALGGQSKVRDFYLSTDTHNHGLFKVLVPKVTKTVKVKTYSLADFLQNEGINKVELLKLDIEGAEFETLAKFDDWDKIKNIVLEYHDFGEHQHQELEKLLKANNFKVKIRVSKYDSHLGFIFATK